MSKALVVFLFGLTLYITLNAWYKEGNTGTPDPSVIAPSAYLFGILALTADFLEGLPVILAAALTFILWERTQKPASTGSKSAKQPMNIGKKG